MYLDIEVLRYICEYRKDVWMEILTFWHRRFTFNSNKSPTWCNNFPLYYPDVCLQLDMFRAFSHPSSGAQWVQWQPLVLPLERGGSSAVGRGRPGCGTLEKLLPLVGWFIWIVIFFTFNPLKPELNPICYLLALLGAHHFLHISRIRVKLWTFRLLMS